MEKPFLIYTSNVFDGADLIDCIRQSCMDLDEKTDGELVEDLIKDCIEKLSGDCPYEVANEIIALLSKCFSVLSKDPMPHLKFLFEKSKKNAYLMYSFISVLSYLVNNKPELDFAPYLSFVNDSMAEIKSQTKYKDSLTLSSLEIPLQFRANLIVELLLCSKPTEQIIDDFPFVFTSNFFSNCPKLKPLVEKVSDAGFSTQLLFLVLLSKDDDDDNTEEEEEKPKENSESKPVTPNFEDPLFNEFLNDPHVEENEAIKKKLLKKMLTDKSNLLGYLQIIFENLSKLTIEPVTLLEYFYEEFEMSHEDFVKILDNVYILHPTEKVFVPQPKYKPLNLPDSEFNKGIITKLFDIVHQDPGHFQAFYCLECIANSFPFIFASDPQKVFDAVLPAFDNYKIIFDESSSDDEEEEDRAKIRKGKSAIAAISFLLFALNSTKVCDAFVQWFFANINNLSLSQLLCIFIVFIRLFSTRCMDHLATLFIKNNFFEACSGILLKKVPENLFGLNFNHFMYTLFLILKNLHDMLSPLYTLAIDINKNEDNLFYNKSGCRLTYSLSQIQPPGLKYCIYIESLRKLKIKKEFLIFINDNENFNTTWTTDDRFKKDLPNGVDEVFINIYKQLIPQQQEAAGEYIKPDVSDNITNDQILLFANKEEWIAQYGMLNHKFPLLKEHKEILEGIMNEASKEDKSITDKDDKRLFKNFSMKEYFKNSLREGQTFLRNLIIRTIKTNVDPLAKMSSYLNEISFNKDDYETVMNSVWENITFIDQNYSYTQGSTFYNLKVNVLILASFAKQQMESKSVKKSQFTKIFFEKIGNKFINFILKPQFRSNENILMMAYEMLRIFDNYPIRVLHLIGYMFLMKDNKFRKNASRLCLGLEPEQVKSINIIEDVFREELTAPKPQLTIMSNILKSCANIGLAHKSSLLTILEELLNRCQRIKNGENVENYDDDIDKDDVKMKDFIIQMLDYLSPDRDENRSFTLSDSTISSDRTLKQNEQYRFCPIPGYIIDTAPEFWKVFSEYRPLINEILLKEFKGNKMVEIPGILGLLIKHLYVENFSSRLVSNYPECFSFEFRSTFFNQTQHEAIKFYNEIEVEVEMTNLYESSYKALHDKSPDEWKQKFLIKYDGSEGLDISGVTKDWFTKLTLEIFNPKNNLFEMSDKNQNYSPSRSSFAQSEEGLKRLKFAGMIIARALMQGFLVPIQLTKPFLKQILHHEKTIRPEDLEDVSEELFNQLNKIKEYDFDKEDLDFRFEVDFEGHNTELIENGSETRVDNKNKEEFVKLRSLHRMIGAIRKQVDAFCEGFDSIIPHEKIRMFTPTELCLLICGVPRIDVDDFIRNVVIDEPYTANSPVIKLFFATIKKWDDENLAKLLLFITGTLRMPANGFVYFRLIDKPITICGGGDRERLPVAHTCVNTLDLPEYETEEEMNSKLLTAITVQDFQIK